MSKKNIPKQDKLAIKASADKMPFFPVFTTHLSGYIFLSYEQELIRGSTLLEAGRKIIQNRLGTEENINPDQIYIGEKKIKGLNFHKKFRQLYLKGGFDEIEKYMGYVYEWLGKNPDYGKSKIITHEKENKRFEDSLRKVIS